MQVSKFGEQFNQYSGITQLMDDLNDGLRTPGAIMLGGGNPAAIPAMLDYFHQASEEMLASGELVAALTNYDGPQGKDVFVKALAQLFRETYGWDISEKNISLTNGSQSGFFYLF
ncbi:valine--pyruvate transaminase, partial [Escherichia coli]|nr:valine--pyruvate transaminase [Escherichia coli]